MNPTRTGELLKRHIEKAMEYIKKDGTEKIIFVFYRYFLILKDEEK